ncbi:unnamed protein product [Chilo suppressalis]|uniref:CRAL-TRIO domain-containing protein n=1 Tax=Chilo suppressalis TaxID=168631 RepID=A0ABN8B4A6_CHISP|nr:unnamed protein product [Chilo suppressalis]
MPVELEYDYESVTASMDIFSEDDINSLKQWTQNLDKSKYVPKDLTTKQLVLFYNACYGDLDRTKGCIEKYYSCRKNAPEFFDNRRMNSPEILPIIEALEFSLLPGKSCEGYDVIYHRLHQTEPSKYHFDMGVKLFFMTIDMYLSKRGPQSGLIFLFDMRGVKLGHIARCGLSGFRKFFTYIQEAMPLNFHHKDEDMDKFFATVIPRSVVPSDNGGSAPDTQTLHKKCMHHLQAMQEYFVAEEEQRIAALPDKKRDKAMEKAYMYVMSTMSFVDNNQFEVKPNPKSKRKITTPCPNTYHNPGLDLLANEDPMCNTAMEVLPVKKRKRSKSCDVAAFENVCLDSGVSKAAVNEFLAKELENVRKTMRQCDTVIIKEMSTCTQNSYSLTADKENIMPDKASPIYTNVNIFKDITEITLNEEESVTSISNTPQCMDMNRFEPNISAIEMDSGISVLEQKSFSAATNSQIINDDTLDTSINAVNLQKNVTNQVIINNTSNINLSFIDRLALDSPNLSNQSLYFDDDLNESNIMEIKTITIITKKKKVVDKKRNTNPFLDPNLDDNYSDNIENPFLNVNETKPELEYNDVAMARQIENNIPHGSNIMPRRLFTGDTNSTISTVNESMNNDHHDYENIDNYRSESPIYENVSEEMIEAYNKQSKILGCDVSRFSAIDIMNLNKQIEADTSNESNNAKKDFKHQILKASNKLSKKVFKTLKRTFKHDKVDHNVTLNPYEVPRKPPKQKSVPKDSGIENPALNLDNSDEIEIEEIDDEEHQYETVKTIRNTQLNMNVTPLRERALDNDISQSKPNTPGKKVRFDSTLNQEKVITGNSFDYGIQSPGFDAKIDKYHDELENCINERKFIQQNM